jgi:NAD(P)-dependent dehydrogenase (short-subunit alcohol dehydrogenase family)
MSADKAVVVVGASSIGRRVIEEVLRHGRTVRALAVSP